MLGKAKWGIAAAVLAVVVALAFWNGTNPSTPPKPPSPASETAVVGKNLSQTAGPASGPGVSIFPQSPLLDSSELSVSKTKKTSPIDVASAPPAETFAYETVEVPQASPFPSDSGGGVPLEFKTHRVEPGESLWKISERYYGFGKHFEHIWKANQDKLPTPQSFLSVGSEIRIPPKPLTVSQPELGIGDSTDVYVVQAGDTLSSIAEQTLGSSTLWLMLYNANRETVPDPHRLSVGLKLRMPPPVAPVPAEFKERVEPSLEMLPEDYE